MKLDRLLAITMLLINRKRMTAKELADRFEVSVRTILRDVETINQAGIPIVSYQGANGGLGIMENYKIDRNVLTKDEILSIIIALKGVSTTLDDRTINHTLEKIEGLILEKGAGNNRIGRNLIIDFSPWGSGRYQRDKLNLIRKAIEESYIISFCYTNSHGENILREVEPMSLAFKGYSWYLYAFCRIRGNFRIFRLSRMKGLKVQNFKFVPRENHFEVLPWEMDTMNSKPDVELVMRFSPRVRVRVEDFFDAEFISEEGNGYTVVRVSFPEDDWVYGTILSFGEDVEVLEPEHIKEIIREKARKIWEKYK